MARGNLISQKLITSKDDILEIDIIDFNRLNGSFQSPAHALNTIFSWYNNAAVISIIDYTSIFEKTKRRNDWPGWKHSGNHEEIGRHYWDFFWAAFSDKDHENTWLQFSDSPDFQGAIEGDWFWGDIGKVSASAFAISQKQMMSGSLWISLLGNGGIHVLIESLWDIQNELSKMIFED